METVVIVNGNQNCSIGLCGYDTPTATFPTVVGTPKNSTCGEKYSFVGYDAANTMMNLKLEYPIQDDKFIDFEQLETLCSK